MIWRPLDLEPGSREDLAKDLECGTHSKFIQNWSREPIATLTFPFPLTYGKSLNMSSHSFWGWSLFYSIMLPLKLIRIDSSWRKSQMPLGLIQNKCLNVIHTVFLFSRQRSLNRVLSKASAAWCSTLGHLYDDISFRTNCLHSGLSQQFIHWLCCHIFLLVLLTWPAAGKINWFYTSLKYTALYV